MTTCKPTTKKPKLTAAEKRAAAAAERDARQAQFEAQRPALWLKMWVKALRLQLIVRDDQTFQERNSWWFDDFRVDAVNQSFAVETTGGAMYTEATLPASDFERVDQALDGALDMYHAHVAEQERLRLEELRRQEVRKQALEKLNPEERKALNLPSY